MILPRLCIADLPPLPNPGVATRGQLGRPAHLGLHLPEVERDSEDHLSLLARIDLLLRDTDRLLGALQEGRVPRKVRAASPDAEQIAIFHDASGTLWRGNAWPEEPAVATGGNSEPAAAGFVGGSDPIVPFSSTETGDAGLLAGGWQSDRAQQLQKFSVRGGMPGSTGNRIQGHTNVSRRRPESQRRTGGSSIGDQHYLDWPWAMRPGRNMFYWLVGPPTSIICISIALGAIGSSRRN